MKIGIFLCKSGKKLKSHKKFFELLRSGQQEVRRIGGSIYFITKKNTNAEINISENKDNRDKVGRGGGENKKRNKKKKKGGGMGKRRKRRKVGEEDIAAGSGK